MCSTKSYRFAYLFFFLFVSIISTKVYTQIVPQGDEIYTIVDEQPEFHYKNISDPRLSLTKYLKDNVRYPSNPKCKGKVFVEFILEKDGSIHYARVVKGLKNCNVYNDEALRIIKSMPKWIPGRQNGENVRIRMILPVSFETHIVFSLGSKEIPPPIVDIDTISGMKQFVPFDSPPNFPGGIKVLNEYFRNNSMILYYEIEDGGEILIEFVINEKGFSESLRIIRDFNDATCNLEATRLIWNMPRWDPAERNGEFVEARMVLPILVEKNEPE
jgi:hypothetical protein